jgi:putative ABC transport system permease protein
MQLKDIAWQSLKRRRARFAFMLAALALGCGTVVALTALSGAMQREIGDELDRFGANIVITPKARAVDLAYGSIAVAGLNIDTNNLASKDAELVRTIPNKRNISAVAPKLLGTTLVNDKPALVIGAIFREERRMKTWWDVEGQFADGPTAAMLGSELARELGVAPGGVVSLGDRQLTVAGVLAPTGTVDDQALFAELGLVQDVLQKPGSVSVIEVSALCRGCPIEDIVAQISTVLPNARVAPIAQAVAARERTVQEFTRFAYAVSVIVLFVGLMVVLTTMMGSVTERTQEIGVLRAIGFRQKQIATILLLESTAINVAGGVLGWAAGTAAAVILAPMLAALSDPIRPSGTLALLAVSIALVVGASGSAYPAWRAARMNPAHALRHL